jgi:DNA invertase Pin-like site-specific DNA recombinase
MTRVGYGRVSTDEQGLGIAAQESALRASGVDDIYQDVGVSGAAPLDDRPGLLAAISALNAGDQLVVVRRDRLAWKVLTAAIIEHMVEKAGAVIHSLAGEGNGDGPEDALIRTVIAAISEYERAVIAARTTAALAVKRARGEVVGHPPYGFDREGDHLVSSPAEQHTIARAKELHASGLSLRKVARTLAAEGLKNRTGETVHAVQVARLVAA